MKKFAFPMLALMGGLLAILSFSAPAHAQATRTWVSGVGDDANPCSRTAPCKTFPGAISKTAAGGEINTLDPGGFGAVTITKSISIISGHKGGVLVSGTNAIIVNAPDGSKILLEGLDIEGLGTGLDGVKIIGSGKVTIRDCEIRNFTGNGVNLVGTANARVLIEKSMIIGNTGGFNIQGAGGVANNALVLNTLMDNNSSFAVQVTGASTLVLSASQLSATPSSIIATGGAAVVSFGNNVLRGAGLPTQTVPLQ